MPCLTPSDATEDKLFKMMTVDTFCFNNDAIKKVHLVVSLTLRVWLIELGPNILHVNFFHSKNIRFLLL